MNKASDATGPSPPGLILEILAKPLGAGVVWLHDNAKCPAREKIKISVLISAYENNAKQPETTACPAQMSVCQGLRVLWSHPRPLWHLLSSHSPEGHSSAFCSSQPNCSVIAWTPAWLCRAETFPHLSDLLSKQPPLGPRFSL